MKAKRNESNGIAFELSGEVTKVYGGKNYDYVTIKVDRDGQYYDLPVVLVNKCDGIEVNDKIHVTGHITTFFDKVRKINTYTLMADSIEEC